MYGEPKTLIQRQIDVFRDYAHAIQRFDDAPGSLAGWIGQSIASAAHEARIAHMAMDATQHRLDRVLRDVMERSKTRMGESLAIELDDAARAAVIALREFALKYDAVSTLATDCDTDLEDRFDVTLDQITDEYEAKEAADTKGAQS